MDEFRNSSDRPDLSGKSESESRDAASATAIFGKAPATAPKDDLLASLLKEKSEPVKPAAASPSTPVQEPAAASPAAEPLPGEFTRMLQSLRSSPPASGQRASSSQDLANIFRRIEKPQPSGNSAAAEETRPFAAPAAPKSASPAAPPAVQTPAPSSAEPPSFTQLFGALSTQPPPAPEASAPGPVIAKPEPEPQPARSSEPGPGEFTRLFQSVQPPAQNAPPASASPAPPTPAPPPPQIEPGSFTQMFAQAPPQELRPEQPLTPFRPDPRPESDFGFARQPDPLPGAQGGFTQLFQALGKEEAVPVAPPSSQPLPPFSAGPPAAGGFTQLLQSLSAQSQTAPAVPPALPLQPSASTGPGEFTRVISSSALRGGSAAEPPAAAARPALPQAPAAPPLARPAVPQAAPPAFTFPKPPAPEPPAAPAPVAPSGLQKYLPLILVVNVFLLLLIVIILVLLLRHH